MCGRLFVESAKVRTVSTPLRASGAGHPYIALQDADLKSLSRATMAGVSGDDDEPTSEVSCSVLRGVRGVWPK